MLAALVLSWTTARLDLALADEIGRHARNWNIVVGPAGARTLLNTLAGSMITVASLVFSLTLIALTMAATNLGPRIIGHFMRDRVTQLSLGVFIATFLYAVMSLLTIRDEPGGGFVPYVSLLVGVILAILAFGWLIFFVNRVARQIQADNVVAFVARDLEWAVNETLTDAKPDYDPDEDNEPPDAEGDSRPIPALETGYIQSLDKGHIVRLAQTADTRVQLDRRAGHFVIAGQHVGKVWPAAKIDEGWCAHLSEAITVGTQRTLGQDVEFAILQMVDVAVRALSPGINDHNTAVAAIDRLSGALATTFSLGLPTAVCADDDDAPRLWLDPITYDGLVEAAFNEIRQTARGNVAVSIRLLEALAALSERTRNDRQRTSLRRQADSIVEGGREAIPDKLDVGALEEAHRRFSGGDREGAKDDAGRRG